MDELGFIRNTFEKEIKKDYRGSLERGSEGRYVDPVVEFLWEDRVSFYEKNQEIVELKQQVEDLKNKKFARFTNEECWIFQKDSENNLSTLTCPVVISAKDLLEICQKANIRT